MTVIYFFEIALIGFLFMLYADQRTKAQNYKADAEYHSKVRQSLQEKLLEARKEIAKHEATIRSLTTPKERRTNGPKKG